MVTPDQLRKCATCVYLAADDGPADDIARHLRWAAETIENLKSQLTTKDKLILEMVATFPDHFYKNESDGWPCTCETCEILNRPEVKAIMERSECPNFTKSPYQRVIIPEGDSGTFTGLIAEFPGCIVQGDSPQEVYELLDQAAQTWIEAAFELGQTIPEPIRGISIDTVTIIKAN